MHTVRKYRRVTRIPDVAKIEELRKQRQTLFKQLENAEGERQRIVKAIAKGIISDHEAEKTIREIRTRETLLKGEIEKITPQVENVPTEGQIRRKAKLIKRTLEGVFTRPGRLSKMSFEDKRKIVQSAFGGKDANGNRYGVYVHKPAKAGKPVTYEIKGVFADIHGLLPMSEKEAQKILEFGSAVKQNIFSECDAYYGFRFYQR